MPKKEEKVITAEVEEKEATNIANEKKSEEKKETVVNKPEVKDNTDNKEAESGKFMAILAYLGILSLIPYFAEKENKFVVYHAKWGLKLFLTNIACSLALSILSNILFGWLISLASTVCSGLCFVLAIIGIINVCKNEKKPLPIIEKITFLDNIIK